MNELLRDPFLNAVRAIETGPPRDLIARAQPDADQLGVKLNSSHLADLLHSAQDDDALLNKLGLLVHGWDIAPASDAWAAGTAPSSPARRALVCTLLGFDDQGRETLAERRPIFKDHSVVISAPWARWYSPARAAEHEFYWPRYRDYLLTTRKWPAESVAALHRSTSSVLERIADPTRPEAHQSKGLVVGYVQSGKTANFTGVAAKAIDAGYRLVIVMTGTIELLRAQTQRRMDMELVGRQNILGDLTSTQAREANFDYQDDLEWHAGRFLDLGVAEPIVGIRRLTSHRADYQSQFKTLRIDRVDQSKPLFDPSNLFRSAARLAVVKKNAAVLRKLVTDIKANRNAFAEIPVLIIDDESDQASVNTVDPEKVERARQEGREIKERRAINQHIASMLEMMPRAQYVGYTATPFANVFVDPSDDIGIFPRDFVIGLDRPDGYMGVSDFHDLEPVKPGQQNWNTSNELAFVRHLESAEDEETTRKDELAVALDMFVLTGAVKLYRESVDPHLRFRHHTMLVHQSVRKDDHRELADDVRALWKRAGYASPASKPRLETLYEEDVVPVAEARRTEGLPAMPNFEELVPFVGKAVAKIAEHANNPVIVVNSDADVQREQQALDFDRYPIWRILVGGSKLSRGFTVEGLTVTYFRRATNMSDSLTQMGRWFGFRAGYQDLVRLYIAREARFGNRTVDLFEAFEAVARDEAAFRTQLEQYAQWVGDEPLVRPIDIPPLVQQHLPWLMPTAKNKMFNARLVEQSESPFTASGYPTHLAQLKHNLDLWRPLIAGAAEPVKLPEGVDLGEFTALVGVAGAKDLIDAVSSMAYLANYGQYAVEPKLTYFRRLVKEGLLEDFLIVMPQLATSTIEVAGIGPRRLVSRDRRAGRNDKFGEITDVKHRHAAQTFVEGAPTARLAEWFSPRRGAVLLYLVRESDPKYDGLGSVPEADPERGVIVAYSIWVPEGALPSGPPVLRFQVRDAANPDLLTIDMPQPS